MDQLAENPYYQYFIGLSGYQEEPPIDASTLTLFRKRLKMDVIMEANEYMLDALKKKESGNKKMMMTITQIHHQQSMEVKILEVVPKMKGHLFWLQPVHHPTFAAKINRAPLDFNKTKTSIENDEPFVGVLVWSNSGLIPNGHMVAMTGYAEKTREIKIADPWENTPAGFVPYDKAAAQYQFETGLGTYTDSVLAYKN